MGAPGTWVEAEPPALPAELTGPRPYPLPGWARRVPPVGEIFVLSSAALASALIVWFAVPAWAHLAPLSMACLGAGMLWRWRRTRRILQTGIPLVARVERVMMGDDDWQVQYSLAGPSGRETRWAHWGPAVLPDRTVWPQAGDFVFLLADRDRPRRRVVRGFAWAPGRPRRPLPWLLRRVPPAAVAITLAAVLLLVAGLVWLGLRT